MTRSSIRAVESASQRAVLVTGMPRSGTSWVGKILEASGRFVYINEPLNPQHPPGRSPGVLRAPVRHRYQYICSGNESDYLSPFQETLSLRYHLLAEVRQNHTFGDLLRAAKYSTAFVTGRMRGRRPLLDDPFAVFSAGWFASRLGCDVIVIVRHPAAITNSRKQLKYHIDFRELLNQELLLRDWLQPFRAQMEAMLGRDDVIGQGALLWRMIYHVVAEWQRRLPEVRVVRHEDLSVEPLKEYEKLYAQLNLDFDDRIKQFVARSTTGRGSKSAHAWSLSRTGVSRTGFRPMDSRANTVKWKDQLRPDEISRVRHLTEDVANLYYTDDDWPP